MSKNSLLLMLNAYCFAICAWSATPVILNHTESAENGDVIYIQGSGFGLNPHVEYSYNDSNWRSLTSMTSGHGEVTVKVPGNATRLPDLLTVRVSPDNQTWSAPAYINMPIAMSFDTDQVAPGSSFRIFGRNLFFGRVSTVRFVDTVDGSSQAGTVNTSSSTHYVLSVTAPTNIKANHTYQLFVSNGYSGNAQSPVESLAHETLQGRLGGVDYWKLGLPWAADLSFYANIYNVKSDPRLGEILAAGDGIADDTWPIMHAIQVATAAGGGVVYLPAGNYTLHFSNGCGIPLLYKVVLQGAGAGVTNIKYGYPAGTLGGYAVCFADQSGLVDMTVSNVDVAQQWQWSGNSSGNSEVFLKRVTWNLGTSQWLNFISDDRVAIEDSVINQGTDSAFNFLGPLNMQGCQHCTVADSTINFSVCGLFFDHTNDMVFENNQVIRDISVAPNPISVTHSIAANFVKNFVVLNNTFSSVGDALPTNNDGEVINTEGGGQVRFDEFRGSISSATSTSLTDSSQNFFQSPNHIPYLQAGIATVAIVSGEGLGQTRTVTSVSSDGQTITIDHPWDVQPEDGSHYATFDWSGENWTVVNNTLNRNFKGFEIFSASALNLLFESNVLSDSDGIMVSPTENPQGQFGAIFNVIKNLSIIGNTFRDEAGIRPSYVGLIPREDGQTASFGTHIIGANVKANNVIAFTPNVFNCPMSWDDYKVKVEGYLADYYWQSGSSYDMSAPPPLLGTIFQGNMAWHSNAAFYLNSGTAQTSISGTFAVNAGSMLEDVPLPEVTTGSTGTVLADTLDRFAIGTASSSASIDLISGAASLSGGRSVTMGHRGIPYTVENESDNLILFGERITRNIEIVAHVNLAPNSNATGLLMMRSTSLPTSSFVSIGLNSRGIDLRTRAFVAGTAQTSLLPFTGSSAWFKLQKVDNVVTAMWSADGLDWTTVTRHVDFSGQTHLAGIAELSDGTSDEVNSTFDGLTFTPVFTAPTDKQTPVIVWPAPSAIIYGNVLGSAQLNATSNVAGTFSYSPSAGAMLGAGDQVLQLTFTPVDAAHYVSVSSSVRLTVNQAIPPISWSAPASITAGTALTGSQLNATCSIAGNFSYDPPAGTILPTGSQVLNVSFQPADSVDYSPVSMSVTMQVTPINLPVPAAWNQVTIGSLPASILAPELPSVTTFLLSPSDYQIGVGPDAMSILAEQVPSDVSAVARISMPSQASAAAESQLMFRDSTSGTSAFVSIGQLQNGELTFEWRPYEGGSVGGYSFPVSLSPVWVKLTKSGNLLRAYYSGDGVMWQYAGQIGAFFGSSNYLVGLCSFSDSITGPPVLFDNVSVFW